MPRIPLICPRCGRAQRVVPGGPEKPAKVVHQETGREECPPKETRLPEPGAPPGR